MGSTDSVSEVCAASIFRTDVSGMNERFSDILGTEGHEPRQVIERGRRRRKLTLDISISTMIRCGFFHW
jgi:hypothetical protein